MLDRLNQHGRVRALVFGNHGEASPDVHHFIAAAARKLARSMWVQLGGTLNYFETQRKNGSAALHYE